MPVRKKKPIVRLIDSSSDEEESKDEDEDKGGPIT
jgi:hypothetical protein